MIVLLLSVLLGGCDLTVITQCKQYSFYDNGKEIICNEGSNFSSCGYSLEKCSDNNEYYCVGNVQVKEHTCQK